MAGLGPRAPHHLAEAICEHAQAMSRSLQPSYIVVEVSPPSLETPALVLHVRPRPLGAPGADVAAHGASWWQGRETTDTWVAVQDAGALYALGPSPADALALARDLEYDMDDDAGGLWESAEVLMYDAGAVRRAAESERRRAAESEARPPAPLAAGSAWAVFGPPLSAVWVDGRSTSYAEEWADGEGEFDALGPEEERDSGEVFKEKYAALREGDMARLVDALALMLRQVLRFRGASSGCLPPALREATPPAAVPAPPAAEGGAAGAAAAGAAAANSTAAAATSAAAPPPAPRPRAPRLHYLDWVRALVIGLVLAFHCIDLYFNYTQSAAVYLGLVFSPPADGSRPAALVAAQLMQSWFMGVMFFVSGLLSGPSYDRKGAARFLADRALRLLLPLLAYDLVIQPLAFQIARASGAAPAALAAAGSGFGWYFSTQFTRLGHGAGWFLAVLFIFDVTYAATRVAVSLARRCVRGSDTNTSGGAKAAAPAGGAAVGTLPVSQHCCSDASAVALQAPAPRAPYAGARLAAALLGLALLLAALTLAARLGLRGAGLPVGMWVVTGLQFQPGYLPQYILAFALGLAARRADALARLPAAAGPACGAAAALLAAGGGAGMVLMPGSNFGNDVEDMGSKGYIAFFAIWEAFYTVSVSCALLVLMRQHANRGGGRAGAAVSGASYAVYLLHIPVITAFGLAFEGLAWHPATKCLAVTPLVVASTWALGMAIRCIPGVKRVL
ncbi:MAG: acyltransferase family-domain-containing protein [Monoraphidium minutum]|nr:MAG: acyltransferase family-domain-containing protein [Monoraphidium minutum]